METESEQAVNHQNHSGIPGSEIRGVPEAIASSGISLRLWRLYAQAWLVCLLFPILFLAQTPLAPVRLIVAIAGLVAFVVTYTWLMWPHPLNNSAHTRTVPRTSPILFVALMAQVLLLSLAYGNAFLWLFVGVSAVAGVVLPARMAFVIVMGLTLITLGLGVGMSGGLAQTDWLHLVPLVLLVRGLGLDMTGVTRLADALRELHGARGELARRAVTEERLRLARELHDDTIQAVIALKQRVQIAQKSVKDQGALRILNELENLAERTVENLRRMTRALRPIYLEDLGLVTALEMLARETNENNSLNVTFQKSGEEQRLPREVELALYRIAQEALSNVVRHANAKQAFLFIHFEDHEIKLEVRDDGVGFEMPKSPTDFAPSGHFGLLGIRERADLIGGRLEVQSEAGQGTQLSVRVKKS